MTSREFGPTGRFAPAVAEYLTDVARLHDLPQRSGDFAGTERTTFTDMVRTIVAEVGTEPVDLVVLAHSTPDAEPGWPASYLTGALPGEPLSFAVADQGVVAPFTALRIARAYGVRRALVILLDQSAVIHAPETPPPATNGLVALLLDRDRGGLADLAVWTVPDVSPSEVPALLPDGTVHSGPDCTGAWRDLDARLASGGPVVLAGYEPSARCLGVCTAEPAR